MVIIDMNIIFYDKYYQFNVTFQTNIKQALSNHM